MQTYLQVKHFTRPEVYEKQHTVLPLCQMLSLYQKISSEAEE